MKSYSSLVSCGLCCMRFRGTPWDCEGRRTPCAPRGIHRCPWTRRCWRCRRPCRGSRSSPRSAWWSKNDPQESEEARSLLDGGNRTRRSRILGRRPGFARLPLGYEVGGPFVRSKSRLKRAAAAKNGGPTRADDVGLDPRRSASHRLSIMWGGTPIVRAALWSGCRAETKGRRGRRPRTRGSAPRCARKVGIFDAHH